MSEVKSFININDFLRYIDMPLLKHPDFYMVKFEDYAKDTIPNKVGPYKHGYFEVSLSINYDANISIIDRKSNALDNNLSFVSPNQLVTWELNNVKPDAASYMVLFKPEFLPFAKDAFTLFQNFSFFNNNTLSSYQLDNRQKEIFMEYMHKMYQEYNSFNEGSLELIKSYLTIILYTAKRSLDVGNVNYLKTRAEEITFHFEKVIKETKHKNKQVKYYAEKLNISPIYLRECIKKVTQKTAKQIINEYLILEAKSLLNQSKISISEIAFSMGFSDTSNFVKHFKKHTGQTPKNFRDNKTI